MFRNPVFESPLSGDRNAARPREEHRGRSYDLGRNSRPSHANTPSPRRFDFPRLCVDRNCVMHSDFFTIRGFVRLRIIVQHINDELSSVYVRSGARVAQRTTAATITATVEVAAARGARVGASGSANRGARRRRGATRGRRIACKGRRRRREKASGADAAAARLCGSGQ